MKRLIRYNLLRALFTNEKFKGTLFKLLIVLSSALLLIILLFFTDSMDDLLYIAKNAKLYWLTAGFGCMVTYWMLDAVLLHRIGRSMFEHQPLKNTIRFTMIGQFFNSIMPISGAGQPVQVYVMANDGVKPGHAVSIIIIKTVLYQLVIVLYSTVSLIFRSGLFAARVPQFYLLFTLGALLNSALLFFYLLFLYKKEAAKKVLFFFFGLLKKLHLVKDPAKSKKKWEKELDSFSEGAANLKKNIKEITFLIAVQVLQFTLYFAIPYFIQLAIETKSVIFTDVIAAQAMITLISLIVPTPGSTGGFEGISYLFYGLFFRKNYIISAILIYRILTYYSSVVFGGLFSLLAPEKPLEREQ